MDKNAKLDLIARFETAVEPLIDLVKSLPIAALDFRPAIPEAWSIREHAIHFLDADTFAHGRLRLAVAEPGAEVYVWNEIAFRARGRYDSGDALAALETARALRRVSAAMARALADVDWEAYYVRHPQRGRMTLADVLMLYADHAQFHLSYLQRNVEAFRTSRT
jgi:uncharacterized damage-inducible protein DinB